MATNAPPGDFETYLVKYKFFPGIIHIDYILDRIKIEVDLLQEIVKKEPELMFLREAVDCPV